MSKPRPLHVDTGYTQANLNLPPSPSPQTLNFTSNTLFPSLTPPSSPGLNVPTINVPDNSYSEKASAALWPQQSLKSTNRRNESRKLLSHLLDQLRGRPMPPRIHDALFSQQKKSTTGLNGLVGTVREAVKLASKDDRQTHLNDTEDVEDTDDGAFSTDSSFELMLQLKDILSVSILQGWQIFEERYM
jgi:hypothetical protein